MQAPQTAETFWRRVDKSGECWEWAGCKVKQGYGQVGWRGRTVSVHRLAWLLTRGAIPPDREVMHLCNNRACCRPDHLALGTHAENQAMSRLTYCRYGHEYTEENTRHVVNGLRRCRICDRRRAREHAERKRLQAAI